MHLDAARVLDGVIGEGVDLKVYAACFDSVSICFAKGIGAPMGSAIAGSRAFIERAKWYRKMLGGGTRQPGMMAAAALAALDHSIPRFPGVHQLTRATAARIQKLGLKLALPVQTNMIVLDLEGAGISSAAFVEYCAREGVTVFPMPRIVFQHQTSQSAADSLVNALSKLVNDKQDGVSLSDEKVNGGYI